MKILIIEDDLDASLALEYLLNDGNEVFKANNAREALEIGFRIQPDLIVSDWDLNDEIDGVEVCKRLSERHTCVIIFVSGSPLDELKKVSEALAPLHVLTKPIDTENLLRIINLIAV